MAPTIAIDEEGTHMPRLLLLTLIIGIPGLGGCEAEESGRPVATTSGLENRIVDASCGQCQLGLPGEGCDLAVAFDGNAYYVDGSHIDDHGDAHGPAGLCNAILSARVTGRIVEGRFQAERFEVVGPDEES